MRAFGYARVSTSEQADSQLGMEAQRAAIAQTAARLGLEVVHIFEDAGISGAKSIEDRPGLLAAVDAVQKGDVLLVGKRDRIGRDVVMVALLERLVARRGARIVSAAGEGTESDDPSAVLMRRLLDSFAEYERLLIGARTKAALAAKRARGERTGECPWGYRATSDGKLVPEERELDIARLARELRDSGFSLREIVEELRARGVTGRTGNPLTLKRVHILTREVA